ncbi:MAG: nucleoside deaminase [Chitinivibrionales bacterium]|nr:nucleoside deaminase [Chitinivibrionales bacterium]
MDHEYYMKMALAQAHQAQTEGEVPIGAVITDSKGKILGRGYNRIEGLKDATGHAEIIAIGAASASHNDWRLTDCTIYVTLEPCLMCLAALVLARMGTIVYGCADPRAGAVESFYYRQEIERSYHYYPSIVSGVLQKECSDLLTAFFKKIREKN